MSINSNLFPDEVDLEEVSCPLGCKKNDELVLTGVDRLHQLPGRFSVVKCLECGLMRTNPRPTPETMSYYYPEEYGPYEGTRINNENLKGTVSSPLWKTIAKSLIQFNTQRIPAITPGKMLEIGCASGSFLQKMSAEGWEVEGLEYSEVAGKSAREHGYTVHLGSLELAPDPLTPYDIVVGWMVMEHLHYPKSSLEKLNRWVKPGGWLIFSVPNAASLEFRLFNDYWYALQLPTHLFHYTPDTLNKLLDSTGWHIEKIFHQRVLINLASSVGNILDDRWPNSRIGRMLRDASKTSLTYNTLFYPVAYILSLMGQTGRMTIWARKKA